MRYLLYLSILLPNTGLLIGLALVLSLLHVIPLHDYLEVPCHVEEAFTLFWKASQRNEISGPQRRSRLIDLRALVLVVLSTCTITLLAYGIMRWRQRIVSSIRRSL